MNAAKAKVLTLTLTYFLWSQKKTPILLKELEKGLHSFLCRINNDFANNMIMNTIGI